MGIKSFGKSQWDAVAHPEEMSEERVARTRKVLIGFIVAVLVVGVLLYFFNLDNKNTDPGTAPGAAPTVTAPADPALGTDGCLDNTPKDISAKAPAVEQWLAKSSGQMPVIRGAGPCGKPVGGVDTGFAKTQSGALSAAIRWEWQLFSAPYSQGSVDAIRAVVVAGPDRDALIAQAERVLSGAAAQRPDYRSFTRIGGYRIQMQGDTALVDIGATADTGTEKGAGTDRVTLRWVNDDWKVVPADPNHFAAGNVVGDLSGFVPLSPEVTDASR